MQKSGEFDSEWLAYLCTYLSWVGYTELLVLSSATFVHYVAPQAIGNYYRNCLPIFFRKRHSWNENYPTRRHLKGLFNFQNICLKSGRLSVLTWFRLEFYKVDKKPAFLYYFLGIPIGKMGKL